MVRTKKFAKVAIANRGEVAVRIIRACQELGIESVLLHSSADERSLAYRMADERVCIGPAASSESYLNIAANVDGARAAGADAVHPGFGFLSENADFADAVIAAGMVFIGPSPENIRLFGDKITAKAHVEATGGPTVPGCSGEDQSIHALRAACARIGYPVICKAAAGGGGRGLKVIAREADLEEAVTSAQREATAAFGSGRVFLEKYLDRAKHIEVQVFGDARGRVTALLERECSVQRRHQKIIEEALSPSLDQALRARMCQIARELTEKAGYQSAGTVEFLLQDGQFYFMEMNTRLQVEHPVTELVMGVDLVKAQLLTAMGQPLAWDPTPAPRGHAIECRIYAEDPYQRGIPSVGLLLGLDWPHGPGRRFEVGFEAGDEITGHYDAMFAKVIVWDETRVRAIQKMKRTLADSVVFGVRTNIPLLLRILEHDEFLSGRMTTKFFETHFADGLTAPDLELLDPNLVPSLVRGVAGGEATTVAADPWVHRWGP